jgi:hypothetical protein
MHIIGAVTRYTITPQISKNICPMAGKTLCLGMPATQKIISILAMVEVYIAPFSFIMTVFTLFTKATPMEIVCLMTGFALGLELGMDIITMAGPATYLFMTSLEWILGVLFMIKFDLFPFFLVMAILAFFSVLASVHVINTVAPITLGRYVLVTLIRMTTGA